VHLGLLRRVLPRLGLVDRGDLHSIARDVPDLCGQRMHLVAVGLVSRGHRHGQQMTQRLDRLVARRATEVCGPINLQPLVARTAQWMKRAGTLPVLAILCSGPNTICTKARSQILPECYD